MSAIMEVPRRGAWQPSWSSPGFEAVNMFRNVQIRVKAEIGQDPWLSFPALPEVYLAGRTEEKPPTTAPPSAAPQPPVSEAAQAWAAAKDSKRGLTTADVAWHLTGIDGSAACSSNFGGVSRQHGTTCFSD